MSDLIVIGGGPTGIAAAQEAASLGAAVTLIAAEPVGGRANWHSLLPSKVYLTAADHLGEAQHNPTLGLAGAPPQPDLPVLRERIATLAAGRSHHERAELERRGVNIVQGRARFTEPHALTVTAEDGESTLRFDRALVATGSVPVFPAGMRPDGRRILAPRLAGKMAALPDHVVVVGGGVTGAEFAYFFNRAGAHVTWVTDLYRMLPRADADLTGALEACLSARGVHLMHSAPVVAATAHDGGVTITLESDDTVEGSHAFLALGRRPDTDDLGLDTIGIDDGSGAIAIDSHGRTRADHIYAAGDVTGPPYVANRGQAQARTAVRHALVADDAPFRPDTVVEAVYTQPQLAQVGLTEAAAAAANRSVQVYRAAYDEGLKPHLSGDAEGLVKILAASDDGRVLGGGAVGDRAAEILAPVAVAIASNMTISQLAAVFPAYPSLSELVGMAARNA